MTLIIITLSKKTKKKPKTHNHNTKEYIKHDSLYIKLVRLIKRPVECHVLVKIHQQLGLYCVGKKGVYIAGRHSSMGLSPPYIFADKNASS